MKKILKSIILIIFMCSSINAYASDDDKSPTDVVLTPIGWAVGAAVTPAYLGIEYGSKALSWTGENVVIPVAGGTMTIIGETIEGAGWVAEKTISGLSEGAKYTIVPVSKALYWGVEQTYDYGIEPLGKGLYWGTEKAFEYGIVPTAKGIYWGIDKTIDGVVWGTNYSIVPIGKSVVWTAKKGTKYVIVPVYNGITDGVEFVAVPVGKGMMWGAKYTIIPIGKGIGYGIVKFGEGIMWGADTVGDGVKWTGKNVIYPIGFGIGKGVDAVVSPIGKAVTSTTKSTKNAIKKILHKE